MAADPKLEQEVRVRARLCDLYVGTAGAGKSTYCKTRARRRDKHLFVPKSGSRAGSKKPVLGWASAKRMRLLDTQGFLDTEGKKESDIQIELLQAIYDGGIDAVRIVWCVLPNERATDELQKQAAFIVSLLPNGEDVTEFWANSVLIVVKNELSDKYKGGAVAAAVKNGADKARVKVCAIRILDFLDDEDMVEMYNGWSNDKRMDKGVVYQRELAAFQRAELREVGYTRMVKRDDRCLYCGLPGDKRLWRDTCHSGPHPHPGTYAGYGHAVVVKGEEIVVKTSVLGGGTLWTLGLMAAVDETIAVGAGVGAVFTGFGAAAGAAAAGAVVGGAMVIDKMTAKWSCCGETRKEAPLCRICTECGAKFGTRNELTGCNCTSPHRC